MKFFKRRQKTVPASAVPQEIQAYSQAEHREKMGIAVLVGFISLILTLIVLFGMFIGGRWIYRKITGTGTKPSNTTVVEKKDTDVQQKETKPDATSAATGTASSSVASPAQQSENTVSTPQTPAATPATDPTLPRTGPDLDL